MLYDELKARFDRVVRQDQDILDAESQGGWPNVDVDTGLTWTGEGFRQWPNLRRTARGVRCV